MSLGRVPSAARVARDRHGREHGVAHRPVRVHPERQPVLLHVAAASRRSSRGSSAWPTTGQGPPRRPGRGRVPAADGRPRRSASTRPAGSGRSTRTSGGSTAGCRGSTTSTTATSWRRARAAGTTRRGATGTAPAPSPAGWLDYLPVCLNSILYARELDLRMGVRPSSATQPAGYWKRPPTSERRTCANCSGTRSGSSSSTSTGSTRSGPVPVAGGVLPALGRVGDAGAGQRGGVAVAAAVPDCRAGWSRRSTSSRPAVGVPERVGPAAVDRGRRAGPLRVPRGGERDPAAVVRHLRADFARGHAAGEVQRGRPDREARERRLRHGRGVRVDQRGVRGLRAEIGRSAGVGR